MGEKLVHGFYFLEVEEAQVHIKSFLSRGWIFYITNLVHMNYTASLNFILLLAFTCYFFLLVHNVIFYESFHNVYVAMESIPIREMSYLSCYFQS